MRFRARRVAAQEANHENHASKDKGAHRNSNGNGSDTRASCSACSAPGQMQLAWPGCGHWCCEPCVWRQLCTDGPQGRGSTPPLTRYNPPTCRPTSLVALGGFGSQVFSSTKLL